MIENVTVKNKKKINTKRINVPIFPGIMRQIKQIIKQDFYSSSNIPLPVSLIP